MKYFILFLFFFLPQSTIYSQNMNAEVKVSKLTDRIYKFYVIEFVDILAFMGEEGVMLVDTGVRESAEKVAGELKKLGTDKVSYIVNTHSDGDHTWGNVDLGDDALIISHTLCREQMAVDDEIPEESLPSLTFDDSLKLFFNGEEIELIALPSHTNSDVAVYFKKAKILHVGDIINLSSFPSVHISKGGNPEKTVAVTKWIIDNFEEDTFLVTGHGRDGNVRDLISYREMLIETMQHVKIMIEKGLTSEEMKLNKILDRWKEYDGKINELVSANTWIDILYEYYTVELKKGV